MSKGEMAFLCVIVTILFTALGWAGGSSYTRDAIHKEAASHGVGLYQRNSYSKTYFVWREIYRSDRDGSEVLSSTTWPAKQ